MTQYISHYQGATVDQAVRKVLEGVTKQSLFKSDIGWIDSNLSGTITELVTTPIEIELVDGDRLSLYSNDLATSFDCVVDSGGSPLSPGTTIIPVKALDGTPFEGMFEPGDIIYLQGISLATRLNTILNTIDGLSGDLNNQSAAIVFNLSAGGIATLNQDYLSTSNTTELSVSPLLMGLAQGDIIFVRDRISLELVTMEVATDLDQGDILIPLVDPVNFNANQGDLVSLSAGSFASRIEGFEGSITLMSGQITLIEGQLDAHESQIILNSDEITLYSGKITDLEGDRDETFSRLTLTENQITSLVSEVGDNYSQITQTAGRIETLIERGLGTSKITKTTANVSGTNIPVLATRFTLYPGDDIILVDAYQGTEYFRKVAILTSQGSTNIHIDQPVTDLPAGSSVILDAKFLRSSLVQQADSLTSTISDLSDLQGDLTQAEGDITFLQSELTQTVNSLTSSIVSTQLSTSIGRITYSLNGTYDQITITDLEAVLQQGDDLYIVNQNNNTAVKVTVGAYRSPGAEVLVPLDDFYALQTTGTSYVLLRLSYFSSNFSQALDQIELSLTQVENLDGRVTSAETSITLQQGEINLIITDVENLDGRVTQNETAITLQQGEINLRVTEELYREDLAGQSLGLIQSVLGSVITLAQPLTLDLYEGDRLLIREESGEWSFEILAQDAAINTTELTIEGNAEAYSFTYSTVMLDLAGPKRYGSELSIFLGSIEADTNLFAHSSFNGAVIDTPGSNYGKIDLSDPNPYGTQGWALGMTSTDQAVLITHNIYARGIIEGPNLLIDTEASEIDLGNIEMRGIDDGYIRVSGPLIGDSNVTFGPGLDFAELGPESSVMEETYDDEIGVTPSSGFGAKIIVKSSININDPNLPLVFTCNANFQGLTQESEIILQLSIQARKQGSFTWVTINSVSLEDDLNVVLTSDVIQYEAVRLHIRFATDGNESVDITGMTFSQYKTRTIIREDGIYMTIAPGVVVNMLSGGMGGGGLVASQVSRSSLGLAETDEVTFAKVTGTEGGEFSPLIIGNYEIVYNSELNSLDFNVIGALDNPQLRLAQGKLTVRDQFIESEAAGVQEFFSNQLQVDIP